MPDDPVLAAPTVEELRQAVRGTLVSGDTELVEREAMGVLVAGMTADHVLERLRDGMTVITLGDRSDVVLAAASSHAAEGFPSLACIVFNGGFQLHPSIAALVAGLRLRLPIIGNDPGTYDTANAAFLAGAGHRWLATQDLHRAGVDGASLRHHRARCPACHSYPDGDDSADVNLSVDPDGAGGLPAHHAARRRRRPNPQGRRSGAQTPHRRPDHFGR